MVRNSCLTQVSLCLCRLLGKDVALKGLHSLQLSRSCYMKALLCGSLGLHFRHDVNLLSLV